MHILYLPINHPRSELNPSQEMEFLAFIVNSTKMELNLLGKIKSGETTSLIEIDGQLRQAESR